MHTISDVYGPHHLLFRWISVQGQPARTVGNRRKNSNNSHEKTHSASKNNVLCSYVGYERDGNISFCSLLVLNYSKVPTEWFCDILKNGPEIFFSIFELLQPARPTKITIFCWNLVWKLKLPQTIEPQKFSQFEHSQVG